jgi:hypothetical protein
MLILFMEIASVYSENYSKPKNAFCGRNVDSFIVEPFYNTRNNHRALKGQTNA